MTSSQSRFLPDLCMFLPLYGYIKNIIFVKNFIKLEVYHSSTISDYTTNNFYSLRRFNRHRRPSSGTECSVVTALLHHADRRNCDCLVDWEGAKVVETNRCARWIKEAIWIRKTKPTMNRDEGGYRLSHVWDSLLTTPSSEQ